MLRALANAKDTVFDCDPGGRRAEGHRSCQSHPSDLANADWMFNEPLLTVDPAHKAHEDPHRLLHIGFGDMHDERILQVRWLVSPRWKWRLSPCWGSGPNSNSTGGGTRLPTGTPLSLLP